MIIADAREPPFYWQQLRKRGRNVATRMLEYGDYWVTSAGQPRVCVERKRANDFTASILDGRLWRQALGLKECDMAVFLIEGSLYNAVKWARVPSGVVVGAITRLLVAGVDVVSVPGKWWTVEFLYTLDKKVTEGDLALVVKREQDRKTAEWDKKAVLMSAVQAVPGIGRKTAEKIAERYDSLAELYADKGARLVGVIPQSRLRRLREALGIK